MGDTRKETVLVVEDDTSLAKGLALNLRFEGYRVLLAADGHEGLRLACDESPDLIILDWMLPGLSGLDLLARLRTEGLEMQVILLSARGMEVDKIRGLRAGADDYISKPFGLRELLARVEAALRRPRMKRQAQKQLELCFGDVCVRFEARQVFRRGRQVHLTRREFDLLHELLTHRERPLSRESLLRRVWGYDYEGTDRTVDNFMRNLRRKLEDDPSQPRFLQTVAGIGYQFVP